MYVCTAYQSCYVRVAEQLEGGHFSQATVHVAQLCDLVCMADLDGELGPLALTQTLVHSAYLLVRPPALISIKLAKSPNLDDLPRILDCTERSFS